jgi:hypothetical protein
MNRPSTAKARSVVYAVKFSGDRGTARIESTYDNSDTAQRIAEDVRKAIDQNPAKFTDLESYDVSHSGATVILTMRVPIKRGKGILPFGGGM